MKFYKNQLYAVLYWLMPSATEITILTFISFLTFGVINTSFLRDILLLPSNFQLKTAFLDTTNNLIISVFGENIARFGVVMFFWALVGILIYLIMWLFINFSDEVGNNLAITKYIHPKNTDTHRPLLNLFSRTLFQLFSLIAFIVYTSTAVGVFLPYIGNHYKIAISQWPNLMSYKYALLGILIEILVLHLFAIITRTLLLRKRVFG